MAKESLIRVDHLGVSQDVDQFYCVSHDDSHGPNGHFRPAELWVPIAVGKSWWAHAKCKECAELPDTPENKAWRRLSQLFDQGKR